MHAGGDLAGVIGGSGDFANFLRTLAQDATLGDDRFSARNYLLDEWLGDSRGADYVARLGGSPADFADWNAKHNSYFTDRVAPARPASGLPARVDPNSSTWPETFQDDRAARDIDDAVMLVRIEDAARVARQAGLANASLSSLIAEYLTDPTDDTVRTQLTGVLAAWQMTNDMRPIFVGLWDEVSDVLPVAGASPAGWEDDVRDRFGLYHYDPSLRRPAGIDVIVFRYSASVVPKHQASSGARAIVRPTVLDARLFAAFCPAPHKLADGRAVDLMVRLDEPSSELIHAPLDLRAEHVFRVGTVKQAIGHDLEAARQAHLMVLRQSFPNYGQDTDADLL